MKCNMKHGAFVRRMQSPFAPLGLGRRSGSPSWTTRHGTQQLSAERPVSCSVSNRGNSRASGRWETNRVSASTSCGPGGWAGTSWFSVNSVSIVSLKLFIFEKTFLYWGGGGQFPCKPSAVIVCLTTRGLSAITFLFHLSDTHSRWSASQSGARERVIYIFSAEGIGYLFIVWFKCKYDLNITPFTSMNTTSDSTWSLVLIVWQSERWG